MTTITLPRAVVEQALEALESDTDGAMYSVRCEEAITALRASLAQQAEPAQEPVAWAGCGECDSSFPCHDGKGSCLRLPLQQAEHFCDTHCTWADHAAGCVRAEPAQEPVAISDGTFNHDCPIGTLLYTAPPQRKPLTQEEAATLVVQDNRMRGEFSAAMELIRRTEQAHGIKE